MRHKLYDDQNQKLTVLFCSYLNIENSGRGKMKESMVTAGIKLRCLGKDSSGLTNVLLNDFSGLYRLI